MMDDEELCRLLKTAEAVAAGEIPASKTNPVEVSLSNEGSARMFRQGREFVFDARDFRGRNRQKYSIPLKAFSKESLSDFLAGVQMPNPNAVIPTTIVPKWQSNGARSHRFD